MRVLFTTPYFPPEVGAPQTRIYELAVRLSKMGHQASVVTTFPNYPSGVVPREWRGRFFHKSTEHGITIYRIWSYAAANRGFMKRLVSHVSFALFGTICGLFSPRCDINVVESPPLFDGFIGLALKAVRRIPYVFTVSDLWPESAVQMGALKSPALIWASERIEALFYRQATAVLALTAGIQGAIIQKGFDATKVLLFRNSVDCNFFRPDVNSAPMRARIGLSDKEYLVLYAGTFGLAQNLTSVLEAAHLLQKNLHTRIRFVLTGDGAEADLLKAKLQQLRLENVRILSSFPKSSMPELLNAADCVLVPLRDLPVFRGALPTKLFEAMACGRPVVLGIRGEAEDLVQNAKAGICVPPEDPHSISNAVVDLFRDPNQARTMGENGRKWVLSEFSRERRAEELHKILNRVIPERKTKLNKASPFADRKTT